MPIEDSETLNVSIYGIGNFGYAFLKHLDQKNQGQFNLTAYDHAADRVDFLTKHRSHPFLHKETKLSDEVTFTNSLRDLITDCDVLLLAVPSTATREAAKIIKQYANRRIIIVNTAKSLDKDNGRRLSQIIDEELSGVDYAYGLLAGGTIASDLFQHEPLGVDAACGDEQALQTIKQVFQSSNLQVYPTTDLIGVEYAAAFKNIISILAGIVNGMGLSYGAETHMISRTAQQIAGVCVDSLGASPSTFAMGRQCWGNDMWMSCTGNTRNRQLGVLIGQAVSPQAAINSMASEGKLVEGVNTLRVLENIGEVMQIPLVSLLYDMIIVKSKDIESIRKHILG